MCNVMQHQISMIMLTYFIVLLLIVLSGSNAQKQEKDWTKLTLSTGAIRGRKVVTGKNTTAYVFHGVPYAEPPIGDLRYRAPIDKKPWKGELSTTTYKFTCMSSDVFDTKSPRARNESEDCLHANVFTTEKCMTEKNCPVMYYIFGGGWNFGSPFVFGTDEYLVENYQSKGIVLVTITYRMGSFGFFNTGKSTSAVKNVGILDMIHGLRWTQHEIGVFGGDRNKVTVMGHSTGATAADLISLSPKTAGLFHQVVLISGSAGMNHLRADTNIKESRSIAIISGCASENQWDAGDSFEDILDCLRKKSSTELINIQRKQENNRELYAGPSLDEEDGVFPENVEALQRKRRPYRQMIGTTSREFRTSKVIVDEYGKINQPLLFATCVLMAKSRGFKYSLAVGRACVDDYSKRSFDIADLTDDLLIYVPTYDSGNSLRDKGATVYTYSFEYDEVGDASFGKKFNDPNKESPFHAEDLVYIIGIDQNIFTEKDEKIRQIYSGMFADFIKTGDPSPPNIKWQPTDDRNNYFKIDFDDKMNMPGNTNGYHANAINFWTKIAPEIDESNSKYDRNETFSFKELAQNFVKGLKEAGITVSKQMEDEIEKWNDVAEWNLNGVASLTNVFDDVLSLFENGSGRGKQINNDQGQRSIIEQRRRQMIQQILPSIREETVDNRKNVNWQLLFWVTTGVAGLLAVVLLVICYCSCCRRSKRNEYEDLN